MNGVLSQSNSNCKLLFIVCISGKRKSGKDFIAERLARRINESGLHVSICSISHPLKEEFATSRKLDSDRLKGDYVYKELYRLEMVKFGEERRSQDSGYFCRKALQRRIPFCRRNCNGSHSSVQPKEIIIVTDCRRRSDLKFFTDNFPLESVALVRVNASLQTRVRRGFIFTRGIDDKETECALDSFDSWNFQVQNDKDGDDLPELDQIVHYINSRLVDP